MGGACFVLIKNEAGGLFLIKIVYNYSVLR